MRVGRYSVAEMRRYLRNHPQPSAAGGTPPWDPTQLTDLWVFLDIVDSQITHSGGVISAVTNQGNMGAANFDTAAVGNRPARLASAGTGQGAEFDGVDDYLKSAAAIDLTGWTGGWTQVLVYKPLTGIASNAIAYDIANFNVNASFQINLNSSTIAGKLLPAHTRIGGGLNGRHSATTPALDAFHYLIVTHDPAAAGNAEIPTIDLDGASDLGTYSFTANNTAGGLGNQIHYVGRRGGASLSAKMVLLSSMVIGHVIDATERDNLRTWCAARAGL